MKKIFTSESVCSGHPDKICDQISDAVLDAALSCDSQSRVAVETLVGSNICIFIKILCRFSSHALAENLSKLIPFVI